MPPTTGHVVAQKAKHPARKATKDLEGPEMKLPQVLDQLKTFFCQTNTSSIQDSYEIVNVNEVDNVEAGNTPTGQVEWSSQEPSREHISFQLSWWGYRIYFPSRALESLKEQRPEECANFVAVQLWWYLQAIPSGVLPPQIRVSLLALGKFVIPKIGRYTPISAEAKFD
ncbi:hypothetical protein BDV93DRAFT_557533 [Ceratobasidium sp. AG-I]|nr:hypothetical protein BDV93DRAFT_557533 [Ceratobasidium sp. AG-I]